MEAKKTLNPAPERSLDRNHSLFSNLSNTSPSFCFTFTSGISAPSSALFGSSMTHHLPISTPSSSSAFYFPLSRRNTSRLHPFFLICEKKASPPAFWMPRHSSLPNAFKFVFSIRCPPHLSFFKGSSSGPAFLLRRPLAKERRLFLSSRIFFARPTSFLGQ